MQSLGQLLQTGDWKNEKHVPVIHLPKKVKADEEFEVKVVVGEDIKHPNQLEHHISWIKVFYYGDDGKFPVQIGSYEFTAHGEAGVFGEPEVTVKVKVDKPGFIYAMSYCNIHGLWESKEELDLK